MSQIPVTELERAVLTLLAQGHGARGWHPLATRLSSLDVPRSPGLMEVLGALSKRGLARRYAGDHGAWAITPVGWMALEPGSPVDRAVASLQSPMEAITATHAVPDPLAFAREVIDAVDLTLPTSAFPLAFAMSLLPVEERLSRLGAMASGWRRATVARLRAMRPTVSDADPDAAAWRAALKMLETTNIPIDLPGFVDLAVSQQDHDLAALDRWLIAAEGVASRAKPEVDALVDVFEAMVEPACRLAVVGPAALASRAPALVATLGGWLSDNRTWSYTTRAFLRVGAVYAAARAVGAEPEMHNPPEPMEVGFVTAAAGYFRHVREVDARTLALASAALGKSEFIPRCDDQGPIVPGRERAPFDGMALFTFARAVAESAGPSAFIDDAWRKALQRFPANIASGGARWADMMWAARAVGRLHGHDLFRALSDLRASLGRPTTA